jgi:hypothetical protein
LEDPRDMLSKAHARKPWNLNIKHGVTLIPWGGTPRQIFHLFLLFHPVIGTRLLPQALTCHSRDGLVSNNSNSWRREHRALGYPQFSFSRTSSDTSGQETLCFVCKITSQRPYKKLSSLFPGKKCEHRASEPITLLSLSRLLLFQNPNLIIPDFLLKIFHGPLIIYKGN